VKYATVRVTNSGRNFPIEKPLLACLSSYTGNHPPMMIGPDACHDSESDSLSEQIIAAIPQFGARHVPRRVAT
jgi:hypothetical protein